MRKFKYMEHILLVVILILINILGTYYFFRIDLTVDKRYSISHESQQLVSSIEDIIYLGTDNGAYISLNKGDEWAPFSNGINKVAVHDLVIQKDNKLNEDGFILPGLGDAGDRIFET